MKGMNLKEGMSIKKGEKMTDLMSIIIFAYCGVLVVLVMLGLFILVKVDTIVVVPENVAYHLGEKHTLDQCMHKKKYEGFVNNRYIEKCEDCGELLREEYEKALS